MPKAWLDLRPTNVRANECPRMVKLSLARHEPILEGQRPQHRIEPPFSPAPVAWSNDRLVPISVSSIVGGYCQQPLRRGTVHLGRRQLSSGNSGSRRQTAVIRVTGRARAPRCFPESRLLASEKARIYTSANTRSLGSRSSIASGKATAMPTIVATNPVRDMEPSGRPAASKCEATSSGSPCPS